MARMPVTAPPIRARATSGLPNGHDASKHLVIEAEPVKESDRVEPGRFFGGSAGPKDKDGQG